VKQRVSLHHGGAQSGQNFRKGLGQSFRNPQLVQDAKGEDVTEVEIERHDNAGIGRARSMSTRSAARSSPNVRT
jgi:hypothetical protein